jgi:hypothetical protein
MIEAIKEKNHPFKEVVLAHFYLNKTNIFQEIDSWIKNTKPFEFSGTT